MEELLSEEQISLLLATHSFLETPRLWLRPVTLADVKDIYEYGKDEENTYYIYQTYTSLKEATARIADYFLKAPLGKYAICLKENKKVIGTIDLRVKNGQGEIGYALNKNYWGQGIVPEASLALVKFGFLTMKLPHIYATCLKENTSSRRVLEKIGFQKEAEIPKARLFKGRWVTELQYGLTRNNYLKERKLGDAHF